jgi:L,D-transpeptidase YnhG
MGRGRFFQRGFAGAPFSFLRSGAYGIPRWSIGIVVPVAAVALLFLSTSCAPSDASTDAVATALLNQRTAPAAQVKATATALIDSAVASVQDTSEQFSQLTQGGEKRAPQPLTEAGLAKVAPLLGQAEARLIAIYRLIAQGEHREALALADQLVRDHPNFHLAHLVHGDLLSVQVRPVGQLGDVPDTKARSAMLQLSALREESRRRLRALTERPPEGSVPDQFLTLAPQSRHAIAIDASRSRLYLFENQTPSVQDGGQSLAPRLKLLGDFYISVGLLGIEKKTEGDKRTPLGVYYITSTLNPENLPDLYGVGALPINYPNPLDAQRGKTGSGIWLHGTPRDQFVRAPQASDGCVVLSNPDLEKLLATVKIRTTPVVIAQELKWVAPEALDAERRSFEAALDAWRVAKSDGQAERLKRFYASQLPRSVKDVDTGMVRTVADGRGMRDLQLKDVSMLRWQDSQDTMVVTFGEVSQGRGTMRRQYWLRERDEWKIFFEGTP